MVIGWLKNVLSMVTPNSPQKPDISTTTVWDTCNDIIINIMESSDHFQKNLFCHLLVKSNKHWLFPVGKYTSDHDYLHLAMRAHHFIWDLWYPIYIIIIRISFYCLRCHIHKLIWIFISSNEMTAVLSNSDKFNPPIFIILKTSVNTPLWNLLWRPISEGWLCVAVDIWEYFADKENTVC